MTEKQLNALKRYLALVHAGASPDALVAYLSGVLDGFEDETEEEDEESEDDAEAEAVLPTDQPRARACKECNKPGHNRKTCPLLNKERPQGEALPEGRYDEVKSAKEDGLTSGQIADEMNENLDEVNLAYSSPDYQHYLKHRA